jgi:hypothetical protein
MGEEKADLLREAKPISIPRAGKRRDKEMLCKIRTICSQCGQ